MKQFQDVFHSGKTGPTVSLLFSLYTVSVLPGRGKKDAQSLTWNSYSGSIVGAPFAAVVSDKLGRRKTMFVGGIIIIIGTIIIASSSTIPQFVVGRFVLGTGIATMTVSAPAYAMEISPPHWRGRATGKSSKIRPWVSC